MTISAFHEVDVVPAVGRFEGRIHPLDIQAAVRQTRVAQGAGGPGALIVPGVTGQATQTLVHSHTGAIVTRAGLECVIGRMTLVTRRLTRVRGHVHRARAVKDFRQRQRVRAQGKLLAAVVERQRRLVTRRAFRPFAR